MGKKCCVCGCTEKSAADLSFHSFPKKGPEKWKWKKACRIGANVDVHTLLVCSKHFREDDFNYYSWPKRMLNKGVVPTPSSVYFQPNKTKSSVNAIRSSQARNQAAYNAGSSFASQSTSGVNAMKEKTYDFEEIYIQDDPHVDMQDELQDYLLRASNPVCYATEISDPNRDVNAVPEEDLTYDSVVIDTETDVDIQEELQDNLLGASNPEYYSTEIEDPNEDANAVTEEYIIFDYVENDVKVETDIDIQDELENNLQRADQQECKDELENNLLKVSYMEYNTIEIDDPLKDVPEIETTVEHLTSILPTETIEIKSDNEDSAPDSYKIHTNGKPHVCDFCHKSYEQITSLRRHRRNLHGDKPYVCKVCKEAFTESDSLRSHQRIHTSEKCYVCAVCDKKFTDSDELRTHQIIHIGRSWPFICEMCGKKFCLSRALVAHRLIHTGDKPINPHFCNLCFEAFTELDHLNEHKRTHTGEKLHACNVCGEPHVLGV